MARLLASVASLSCRRPRSIIAVWLALLTAGAWASTHQTDHLSSGGWDVPGSESAQAARLLSGTPAAAPTLAVLVTGRSDAAVAARVTTVRAELRARRDLDVGRPIVAEGGRAVLVPLALRQPPAAAVDLAGELRARLVETTPAARTRVVGAPAVWSQYQDLSKRQLVHAELLGLPLVLVILLAGFGTVVAALAPLIVGLAVVVLAGAAIYALSLAIGLSLFVTSVASMIGIGVAVDYSLFIVSRFRSELRAATTETALRRALVSSGTAVVSSAIAVVLALGALLLVELDAIRSVAIGAIVVVVLAVAASVTLLPALLALAGDRVERLPVRAPWRRRSHEDADRRWQAWTAATTAHPVVAIALAGGLLLALSAPLWSIRTANRYLEQLPRDSEVRAATERLGELVGPGFLSPVQLVVSDAAAAAEIGEATGRLEGVRAVRPAVPVQDGRRVVVDVVLGADPDLPAARSALTRVEALARPIAARHGATLIVGGTTRLGAEVQDAVSGGLQRMVAFILVTSFLALLVLLRSVVLPLKAVAMNLLSVGAAYGVLVAVFQWGWLDWTGFASPGHVDTIVLVLVLAVTYGLSMDYEVFLLTRIRELHLAGHPNAEAVRRGLASSAGTITSAALIMVAVFGAFALAGASSVKQLGVGLAVAILVDATVVRLVLVPAAMQLLGDRNWWLPRPLARLLPPPPRP